MLFGERFKLNSIFVKMFNGELYLSLIQQENVSSQISTVNVFVFGYVNGVNIFQICSTKDSSLGESNIFCCRIEKRTNKEI